MNLPNCFYSRLTLNGNDRGLPDEVCNEISNELWPNRELNNDSTTNFDVESDGEDYPAISAFLKQFNINECYITYGW